MQTTWLSVQLNQDKINDYEIILMQYEGALSQPECLLLKILSSQSHAQMMAALNQSAEVLMQNAEQSWAFTLKLFKVEYLIAEELMGRNCFLLELRSPLYDLTRFRMTPVLKDVSIAQMADLLLTGRLTGRFNKGLQPYRFALEQTDIDQPLPMLKGLQESAYDFLNRILRYYGLSYYFDHANQGIMVISDHIAKFAATVQPQHNVYASGELLTEPHYETIRRRQSASVAAVMASGHPYTNPEVLIMCDTDSQPGPVWQVTATEFNAECANTHARWTLEALQGEANRNNYNGGGILFPGMIDEAEAVLLTQTAYTLEFDGHETGRVRVIPMQAAGQRLEFPYRDLPDLQEHTALLQGSLISDVAGSTTESASVGSSGHYHVLLPDYVVDPQPARPMLDTRMVYPMQSDDHKEHFTLMNNAEGLLFYNAGVLGESLLLGTANSAAAGHITAQDTAQNAYWQDDSQNKTAFINEGTFDRTQKTGRHSAYIMEAPNYHPEGSGSYLRMGDPIQNDTGYPAQSAESGILMVSTGHYQEEHQGGLLHLSGNTGEDSSQPIPVYREMTQLNPIGTPHILQTSTANRHDDLKTADAVIQNTELSQGTLSESLTAPGLFNTWSADNSKEILVNQNLQQTGTINTISINTQNKNLSATAYNVTQNATLRTDQISNQTLLRNHKQNLEQYQTLKKSISQSQEAITTQNLAIQNYSRTTQSGVIIANQTAMNAGSFAANTNSMQISSLTVAGMPSGADVAAVEQAWVAEQANNVQQAANQKKEILFYLDDPAELFTNIPYLLVNGLNPLPLQRNSLTIYPLNDQQKEGAILLSNKAQNGTTQNTLHEQMRRLNVQDLQLKMQLPHPYFNEQGQIGGYLGIREVAGQIDLGTAPGTSSAQVVLIGAEDAPDYIVEQEEINIQHASDQVVNWLANKVKNYLINHDSDDISGDIQDTAFITSGKNRAFLVASIKESIVKIIKGTIGALIKFEIISADVRYPFSNYVERNGTLWARIYDWSTTLTPSEYAADLSYAKELKDKAYNWPFIDILLVDSIDYIQYRLAHESPEWLAKKLVDDTFATAAISVLTFFIMIWLWGEDAVLMVAKKLGNSLFIKWFARSFIMGFIADKLKYYGEKYGISKDFEDSKAAGILYKKVFSVSQALQQSNMIQIIDVLMQQFSNPATINKAIKNTDWAGDMSGDYNNSMQNKNIIPVWVSPGEGGI